jgi:hypothetical protein
MGAMKTPRYIAALSIAATVAVAAPAYAADSAPPLKGGRELTRIGGHSLPYVSSVKETGMSQAGTVTVRPRLTKVAVRLMRHYKRTNMKVGLGTLREDGYLWSDPGDWGHTVVVR